MLEELKKEVWQAALKAKSENLDLQAWPRVSGIDRNDAVMAILPVDVSTQGQFPEDVILMDMDAKVIDSEMKAPVDALTHLELYRNFKKIGGICHARTPKSTAWAQARKPLPCLGTSHAEIFYGLVPVTDRLTEQEIESDYPVNIARGILRKFADINPLQIPACLVAGHGPYTWGKDAATAVEHCIALERISCMAMDTLMLNAGQLPIHKKIQEKHYFFRHGKRSAGESSPPE